MAKKKDDTKPANLKGIELTWEERGVPYIGTLMADGMIPTGRRRVPVKMPLTDERIIVLGEDAAKLDAELRTLRQGKNAMSAALNREKREREGAIHAMSARIVTAKDELGRDLSVAERARYTRQHAAMRHEFDQWEEDRKARLKAAADELAERETQHSALSAKILDGYGEERVSVVDLTDFGSGTVISVRVDTGEETGRRALKDHERQMALWEEVSSAGDMTDTEYSLCVAGRINDAAKAYGQRHGIDVMKAKRILVALVNEIEETDGELPPEAGDVTGDDGGDGELPPEAGDVTGDDGGDE